MRRLTPLLVVGLLGLALAPLQAARAIEAIEMPDPQMQARYVTLLHELRCVKCQNEALADSDVSIAAQIRREVRDMMLAGKSDDEIREFLVGRYSEFILFKPRHSWRNAWLWYGPVALLLLGAFIWVRVVRSRSALLATDTDPVSDDSVEASASK
jgi:cytochrome c-type biogenesis protein CcmH